MLPPAPLSLPVYAIGVGLTWLGNDVEQADRFVGSTTTGLFSFDYVGIMVVKQIMLRGLENADSHAKGMIATPCVKMVEHLRGSYTVSILSHSHLSSVGRK